MAAEHRAAYPVRGLEHASEVNACVVNGAAIVLDKGHIIALACQQQTADSHQLWRVTIGDGRVGGEQ